MRIMLLVVLLVILAGCSATPAPVSPWLAIVDAYIGPDANPSDADLRQSFTKIMELANTIVLDPEQYTDDESARAQAIFDAAADAHDALRNGDGEVLASRWQSLDTFVVLLRDTEH